MTSAPVRVVGLMSGTSLDGLDIACCEFRFDQSWRYHILAAETIAYTASRRGELRELVQASAEVLAGQHAAFGRWMGEQVTAFLEKHRLRADLVASHGHTLFHQPAKGFTFQLGSGASLATACGLPVVCDFRSADVALGGQGAPLVPVGDQLLFGSFTHCLNLGGIANISFDRGGKRIAGDLVPCNLLLNPLAERLGMPFDRDGAISRSGRLHEPLLAALRRIGFLRMPLPKSLGREDVERDYLPLFASSVIPVEDQLRTATEFIAQEIVNGLGQGHGQGSRLLVTGGGALNAFLLERLRDAAGLEVVVPEREVVEFKEALIFAFLGLLRWKGEVNVLSSVTGSARDHSAGAIYP
jgi:anhydro-N-acetylmuramic acid kinase